MVSLFKQLENKEDRRETKSCVAVWSFQRSTQVHGRTQPVTETPGVVRGNESSTDLI